MNIYGLPDVNTSLLKNINGVQMPEFPEIRDYRMADYQYELICQSIKDFESTLDLEHEISLQLSSFGQSILLNVTDIGYSNPSIIHFYGYVNNQKAHLIQNVNQLNFLMLATPKTDPQKPARRIGFNFEEDIEK